MEWLIWAVWSTALVVLAFLYVGGPILLRAMISWNFKPEVREIDPSKDVIDDAFKAHAHGCHDALIQLGFESGPLLLARGLLSNVDSYAAIYRRRTDGRLAMVQMQVGIVNGQRRPRPGMVELANDFSGGLCVTTINGPDYPFLPLRRPEEVVVFAPEERSIAALLALQKEACRRAGGVGLERDVKEGWGERLFWGGLARYAERGMRHGYLRARRDGRHGLTWKGAFILACTMFTPTKWYFRRRADRELRELKRTMLTTV
jgi:hypothetical protein